MSNGRTYSSAEHWLFILASAPFRFFLWFFDLTDSQGDPSLLKMAAVFILAMVFYKAMPAAVVFGMWHFLTVLIALLAIASRKSLEAFANRITLSLSATSATQTSIAADANKALDSILQRRNNGIEDSGKVVPHE